MTTCWPWSAGWAGGTSRKCGCSCCAMTTRCAIRCSGGSSRWKAAARSRWPTSTSSRARNSTGTTRSCCWPTKARWSGAARCAAAWRRSTGISPPIAPAGSRACMRPWRPRPKKRRRTSRCCACAWVRRSPPLSRWASSSWRSCTSTACSTPRPSCKLAAALFGAEGGGAVGAAHAGGAGRGPRSSPTRWRRRWLWAWGIRMPTCSGRR